MSQSFVHDLEERLLRYVRIDTTADSDSTTSPSMILSPKELPYLGLRAGDDIVTASGTTLLGADDKAGVAIVMATAHHLLANPDIPDGKIRIGFTFDEEIGRGVHADLPRDLAADVAYTLDGAQRGCLTVLGAHPQRHRWLAPGRTGRSDSQPFFLE